jgi:hypothetical protein
VVAGSLVLFFMIEGGASSVLAVNDTLKTFGGGYERYDSQLGWVNRPSLAVKDAWGDGRDLHTNSRGFRGEEVSDVIPPGRRRALCSGDSFTYGEGVGDFVTWCYELSQLIQGLDTVNLGTPGYGVDQAFLRYQRDASSLDHDLHIFAFIGADLDRAGLSTSFGYGRPSMRVIDDALVATDVPVPRLVPAIFRGVARFGDRLKSVELASRLGKRIFAPRYPSTDETVRELGPLLRRLFTEVVKLGESRGATTVFVYLPVGSETDRDHHWRPWVRDTLAELGYPLIDLTDELRKLPSDVSSEFYIAPQEPAGGHYSSGGNGWVANEVANGLQRIPAAAEKVTPKTIAPIPISAEATTPQPHTHLHEQ